jgi:hypothetical protein
MGTTLLCPSACPNLLWMADYYSLIAREVAALDTNTGDTRGAFYERARAALVEQLRAVTPTLDESEVTRERLSLEDAIRRVEREVARESRSPSERVEVEAPTFPAHREEPAPESDPLQELANLIGYDK